MRLDLVHPLGQGLLVGASAQGQARDEAAIILG